MLFKCRLYPFCTDDLFFTLSCINSMLRQKHFLLIDISAETRKKSSVPRTDRVINICLRHFASHQIKNRKQHRTHRVKCICKRSIWIIFYTALCQYIQKLFTFQKGHRVQFLIIIKVKQNLPVRTFTQHQFLQAVLFFLRKNMKHFS